MDLEQQLYCNLEDILNSFGDFTHCVQVALEKKNVDVGTLRTFLLGFPAFISGCGDQRLMLLASKKNELEKCSSVCEIFALLKTQCSSFLNCRIFERIMKSFEIKTDQEYLNYPDKLKAYIEKHRVSEFVELKPIISELTDDTKELVLVLDIPATSKLAEATNIVETVAKIMNLNPSAVLIHSIKRKCVVVTVLIPTPVADYIFVSDDIFSKDENQKFRNQSVQQLRCSNYCFDFTLRKIDFKIQSE